LTALQSAATIKLLDRPVGRTKRLFNFTLIKSYYKTLSWYSQHFGWNEHLTWPETPLEPLARSRYLPPGLPEVF
jgi:hypothetical protein